MLGAMRLKLCEISWWPQPLRRARVMNEVARKMFSFEGFTLDLTRRSLRAGVRDIELRPKNFDVLAYLVEHAGKPATRDEIIQAIWSDVTVTEESLTRCVSDIRLALGDGAQRIIKTLPRLGYVLAAPVVCTDPSAPTVSAAAPTVSLSPLPQDDRPAIAVLAFENLSGEPGEQYFCDGITEDIITELSRFSSLIVIARNSTFQYKGRAVDVRRVGQELGARYVLEGSIRREGERLRMTAQLIDATTGAHRWAERYDRRMTDVFAVQDEIARTIAALVAAHVDKTELRSALLKPPASLQAYDCYLRGVSSLNTFFASYRGVDHLYEARRWLEQAIAIDPRHARSYAALCQSYIPTYQFKHDGDFFNPIILEKMRSLSLRAIELEPDLPDGHIYLGHLLGLQCQHDASIAAHERALALNPNRVHWRFAIALVFAGQHERAIEVTRACMRLDPFYPPTAPGWLGIAYFMLKRYSDALPPLLESASRATGWLGAHTFLAATYAGLGELDRAGAAAAEVLRIVPEYTIGGIGQRLILYKRPEDAQHYIGALRLAGLPE
jgi:adenylate cyclase